MLNIYYLLTVNSQQSGHEVFRNQRLRQVAEELLQQGSHIVHGNVLVEHDLGTIIKIFP